jgi:hypothetical protein
MSKAQSISKSNNDPQAALGEKNIKTHDVVLSGTEVTRVESQLQEVVAMLGGRGAVSSAKARRERVKMPKGGEQIIPLILAIATRHNIALPTHPTREIEVSAAHAMQVRPLLAVADSVSALVGDLVGEAGSVAWRGVTRLYSVMLQIARDDAALAHELSSIRPFFARKRKEPAQKTGTTTDTKKKAATKKGKVTGQPANQNQQDPTNNPASESDSNAA